MQTRTYQLVTSISQANACNVTIIAPGYIHGVCWTLWCTAETDNAHVQAELSFQNASQLQTHNALGVIDAAAVWTSVVGAAGVAYSQENKACLGMYMPVGIGQVVYLNTSIVGAGTVKAVIHIIEK